MTFTDDSIQLRNYLFSKIENKDTPELNKLYNKLNNLKLYDITIEKVPFIVSNNNKEIQHNKYIQEEVKLEINKLKENISFILKINNSKIQVNVYYNNEDLYVFICHLINYIQYIFSLVDQKNKPIIINYYLLDKKKIIKSNIPNNNEINSGSCTTKDDSIIINIWRKEEILKVTLHELIHALKLDRYNDTNDIINHYRIRYNVSSYVMNTHEAYTELWANLLNCYFISQKTTHNNKGLFIKLVLFEKCFSDFQANKIFFHTNLDKKEIININKNTNVLAYFIIRNELYNRLPLFLDFCFKNNDNYIKLKNKEKWLQFLKENKKLKRNNKKFNNSNKQSFHFKTLRMSINESKVF